MFYSKCSLVTTHPQLKDNHKPNQRPNQLSEDDGPPAHEFLGDDYGEDNAHLNDSDDEPLSEHVRKATQAWREPNDPEEGSRLGCWTQQGRHVGVLDGVRFLCVFLFDDDDEAHERLVTGCRVIMILCDLGFGPQ